MIGADTTAKYVWFQCAEGYSNTIDMPTALHPQTQLTLKFDHKTLPVAYGFPIKIRIPTKLGFKNPKYVTAMWVQNNDAGGYWENQGYNWFSGLLRHFTVLRRRGGGDFGDQPGAALEGDVAPQPGQGDDEAIAQPDQKINVHHAPEQPADKAPELNRSELHHGGAPADRGQHAHVSIAERRHGPAGEARDNEPAHVVAHLLGRRRRDQERACRQRLVPRLCRR